MTDQDFDQALIAAAFALAAREGWGAVSPAAAAREGGLKLETARTRFPSTLAILMRFGEQADAHALADALDSGPTRERLFDILMRRFDALQHHRAGVLALLTALPANPPMALALAAGTGHSMGWMLEGAGVSASGMRGTIAAQGMVGVWLYALRAWRTDETADLSGTMAALDRALTKAEQAAAWLGGGPAPAAAAPAQDGPKPFPEPAPEDAAALAGTISGAAEIPPTSDPGI